MIRPMNSEKAFCGLLIILVLVFIIFSYWESEQDFSTPATPIQTDTINVIHQNYAPSPSSKINNR